MAPRIGNRTDAVALLTVVLGIDGNDDDPLHYRINDLECTLREVIEILLDSIELGII